MPGQLFHPSLREIPLPFRFAISGIIGNGIFMAVYNLSLNAFRHMVGASIIFGIVQFGCIILNHFLNIGIVFGWPEQYTSSLMSNMPVGLSALCLGAVTTSLMETIELDAKVNAMLGYESIEESGFWGSIAVMVVTGVFSYLALNFVNAPVKGTDDEVDTKKDL